MKNLPQLFPVALDVLVVRSCVRCHKDHNSKYKLCEKCREYARMQQKKHVKARTKNKTMWRKNNPDKFKEAAKRHYFNRRDKSISESRERKRKHRANIDNSYILHCLNTNNKLNFPIEFFELYRKNIQLKRMVRKNERQND